MRASEKPVQLDYATPEGPPRGRRWIRALVIFEIILGANIVLGVILGSLFILISGS